MTVNENGIGISVSNRIPLICKAFMIYVCTVCLHIIYIYIKNLKIKSEITSCFLQFSSKSF